MTDAGGVQTSATWPTSRWLEELTWPLVAGYLERPPRRLIVVLGATENHGPHMPLGTDSIIARAVASRMADRLDALIAPLLPIGYSPQHLPFPGSISWSNRLLADAVVNTVVPLAVHGFTSVVVYSGHGGNRVAIDLAIGELMDAMPSLRCVHAHQGSLQTSEAFRQRVARATGEDLNDVWGAHGGEQETSAVLATNPDLVRQDSFPPPPDIRTYLRQTRDPFVTLADRDLRRHAPYGTWGNPERANAEQGTAFYDLIAEHLADKAASLLVSVGC